MPGSVIASVRGLRLAAGSDAAVLLPTGVRLQPIRKLRRWGCAEGAKAFLPGGLGVSPSFFSLPRSLGKGAGERGGEGFRIGTK